jgi:hypothetical protein
MLDDNTIIPWWLWHGATTSCSCLPVPEPEDAYVLPMIRVSRFGRTTGSFSGGRNNSRAQSIYYSHSYMDGLLGSFSGGADD